MYANEDPVYSSGRALEILVQDSSRRAAMPRLLDGSLWLASSCGYVNEHLLPFEISVAYSVALQ